MQINYVDLFDDFGPHPAFVVGQSILGSTISKVNVENELQINQSKTSYPRYDFINNMGIEVYHGENRQLGKQIIKNNDMLQYHYFGQSYQMVDVASVLVLIYINHNGIKNYIGFYCFTSPTLQKIFRRMNFGLDFFPECYNSKRVYAELKNMQIYVLSRMVILPSYRGLGLNKKIQELCFYELEKQIDGIFYIEIASAMLHNFDFLSNQWNKTVMQLEEKHYISENYGGSNSHVSSCKGESKYYGLVASKIFLNEYTIEMLKKYYNGHLNLKLTEDDIITMCQNVDLSNISTDLIDELIEKKIPLALLSVVEHDIISELTWEKWQDPKWEDSKYKNKKKQEKLIKDCIKYKEDKND